MPEYDNDREFILRKVVSENPKAPTMAANAEIDGVRQKVAFWPMTRRDGSVVKDKNGNTLYKGRLEVDDYEPQTGRTVEPPADDFDDEIPF